MNNNSQQAIAIIKLTHKKKILIDESSTAMPPRIKFAQVFLPFFLFLKKLVIDKIPKIKLKIAGVEKIKILIHTKNTSACATYETEVSESINETYSAN